MILALLWIPLLLESFLALSVAVVSKQSSSGRHQNSEKGHLNVTRNNK